MLKNYGLIRKNEFLIKESTKSSKDEKLYNNSKKLLDKNYPNNNSSLFTINTSSSHKQKKEKDNRTKPYSREKIYEKNYKKLKSNNYFTPSFDENISFRNENLLRCKDPNETFYKNSPLISSSYNIIRNNRFKRLRNKDSYVCAFLDLRKKAADFAIKDKNKYDCKYEKPFYIIKNEEELLELKKKNKKQMNTIRNKSEFYNTYNTLKKIE